MNIDFDYAYARVIADWAYRQTEETFKTHVELNEYDAEQQKMIRYRISQWIVLNRFYDNAFNILSLTYDWILEELPKTNDRNPFESADA